VKVEVHYPNQTPLRRNPVYYTVYCVALNTFFATLFPLLALLFLNVATLTALRKLLRQNNERRESKRQNGHRIEMENVEHDEDDERDTFKTALDSSQPGKEHFTA
jgi:hypothetical protein